MRTNELLVLAFLSLLLSRGEAQEDERVAEVRLQAYSHLAQSLDEEVFLDSPPSTKALILRALQLAGWHAEEPTVAAHWNDLFALDAASRPETLAHRVLLLLEGNVGVRAPALMGDVIALTKAQALDGGWDLDPNAEPDREERITVTALVLDALSRFQARGGNVPESTFERASAYLRAEVRRGGAFGESPRRGRPHGQATAAAVTALWILAARAKDETERTHLEAMLTDAEDWLRKKLRTDRNPDSLTGKYPYLAWLSAYEVRSWMGIVEDDVLRERLLDELVQSSLSSGGWNERVLAGSGSAAPPPNAPRYGIPLNYDAGVKGDLRDTAWGVVTMFRPEWSHPLEEALAAHRMLLLLERFGARRTPYEDLFVRRAVSADDRVLPALLDGLESERSAPRRAAVQALRERAHRTFEYDPAHSPSRNREAIEAWEAWATERLATLPVDPPIPSRRR